MAIAARRLTPHSSKTLLSILALLALSSCSTTTSSTRTAPTNSPTATATSLTMPPPSPSAPQWTVVPSTPAHTVDFRFAYADPSIGYLCAIDGPAVAPLRATPRLYKTTDGGRSWRLVTRAPVIHPVPYSAVPPL